MGVSLVAAASRPARTERTAGTNPAVTLQLLTTFAVACDGRRVGVPMSVQRLVAFVAVQNRPVLRVHAAGSLWPNTSERRAAANLRSALWRLKRYQHPILDADALELRMSPAVSVDLHVAEVLAKELVCLRDFEGVVVDPAVLAGDLLPDWYDDWVLIERERFRQVRLHALETICDRLSAAGRTSEALAAGLAALESEPLRESAHRALVRVHLAQGNVIEALRQYRFYCSLVRRLEIAPSEQMEALVAGIGVARNGC